MTQAENSRNGGPAFPCHPEIIPHRDHDFAGMSLRDYFAAKAMQGMAGSRAYCERGWDQADLAGQAYEIADAMLKARDHGTEGSENDRHVATFLLREALKSCLEYGAMTGADWVTDKARAALAKAGEPR